MATRSVSLAAHIARHGQDVRGAVESMTGARFVHDQLELAGWDVAIGDAVKVEELAPLAAKTDKIDARVLAELARRDLVPGDLAAHPGRPSERERARFRLHLVRHRTALKNRIHATLMTFGHSVPVADLFGESGRELLDRHSLPPPWSETLATSLRMVDELDDRIRACTEENIRALGADHPSIPLLMTVPGVGWVLASRGSPPRSATSIVSPAPRSSPDTTGLLPAREPVGRPQIAGADRWRRTARSTCAGRLIEAAVATPLDTATTRSATSATKRRLGRQRGAKVARVDLARELAAATGVSEARSSPAGRVGLVA